MGKLTLPVRTEPKPDGKIAQYLAYGRIIEARKLDDDWVVHEQENEQPLYLPIKYKNIVLLHWLNISDQKAIDKVVESWSEPDTFEMFQKNIEEREKEIQNETDAQGKTLTQDEIRELNAQVMVMKAEKERLEVRQGDPKEAKKKIKEYQKAR